MENNATYDFSGWATRNDLLCSDGITIKKDAFKDDDSKCVPLVYNHDHSNPDAILGKAYLENRDEGVYAYCILNDSDSGKMAKKAIQHGDVRSLSIYASQLKKMGNDVVHGSIKELSLVLSGANPGAYIDFVVAHGEDGEEGFYATYDENIMLYHSDTKKEEPKMAEPNTEPNKEPDKTIKEIIDSMSEEQQNAMYALIGMMVDEQNNEGDDDMKHNVFETDEMNDDSVLMHSELINESIADAKRFGSLKESFIQHAADAGIENIDYIFPNDHELNVPPKFVKEDETWVGKVMSCKHTPFSRVKTTFGVLDVDEARARGYIKGNMKKELALSLMKRTTTPTTIYIKMKIDRDDAIDITDFDVIAWQRNEMRGLLNKEIARAILIGDGRSAASDDKINELNVRPIISDDDFYAIKYTVTEGTDYTTAANDSKEKGIIRAAVKARKEYKGSGNPTFFTTEDVLTSLLLIEDQNGRRIYESEAALATAMRVSSIVTVTEMERLSDTYGIIVNMQDYTVGADKGGAVSMFDDFDIDFNQMKYLMETRISGALTTPYSAIILKKA